MYKADVKNSIKQPYFFKFYIQLQKKYTSIIFFFIYIVFLNFAILYYGISYNVVHCMNDHVIINTFYIST